MIEEQEKQMIFTDIYRIIYKIKRCRSKSMLVRFNRELGELYSLCDLLGILDYPRIDLYSNKKFNLFDKREYKSFFTQVNQDLDYHIEFTKNSVFLDLEKYKNKDMYTVDNIIYFDETLELAHDFLNEFNPSLKNIFEEKIREKRIIICDKLFEDENEINIMARTFLSCGNFSSYIVEQPIGTIQDASVLCHEIGHCYIGEKNNTMSYNIVRQKDVNCFNEVYTYFINLCFSQYCKVNNLYVCDNEKVINGYNYTLIEHLKKMKHCLENSSEFYYDEILDTFNYSYGIAIAYHFFDRYLKDPEKTKIEIKQFIEDDGSYNFIEMLKKYNLKDEIIDSKVLKKYI